MPIHFPEALEIILYEVVDGYEDLDGYEDKDVWADSDFLRSISWHANGIKKRQVTSGRGIDEQHPKDLCAKSWYPDGELESEEKNGIYYTWYPGGKKKSIENHPQKEDVFWTIDGFEVSKDEAIKCGIICREFWMR